MKGFRSSLARWSFNWPQKLARAQNGAQQPIGNMLPNSAVIGKRWVSSTCMGDHMGLSPTAKRQDHFSRSDALAKLHIVQPRMTCRDQASRIRGGLPRVVVTWPVVEDGQNTRAHNVLKKYFTSKNKQRQRTRSQVFYIGNKVLHALNNFWHFQIVTNILADLANFSHLERLHKRSSFLIKDTKSLNSPQQESPNIFARWPHKLLHNSSRAGHLP